MARTTTAVDFGTPTVPLITDTGYTPYPYDGNGVPRSTVSITPRIEQALSPNIVDNILNAGIDSQIRGTAHPALIGVAGSQAGLAGDLAGLMGGCIVDVQTGSNGISNNIPIAGIYLEDASAAAALASGTTLVYYNSLTVTSFTAAAGDVYVTDKGVLVTVTAALSNSSPLLCISTEVLPASGTLYAVKTLQGGSSTATGAFTGGVTGLQNKAGYFPMVEVINSENVYRMMTYSAYPLATTAKALKRLIGSPCDLINVTYTYPDRSIQYGTVVDPITSSHGNVTIVGVPNDAALLATHEFCPVLVKFLKFSVVGATAGTTFDPTGLGLQL
jgi:hypothetical protein